MPIVERDPWRMQYFESAACPEDVFIPTEDADAYALYPDHRWVYNKLRICETQGIPHGPHGVEPPSYPVFSKPIYNLRGMGMESRILRSAEDYARYQQPGHMWMALCTGEHVSSDFAVLRGTPVWCRHATGKPLEGGLFDYWTIEASPRPALEAYLGDWLQSHLGGYSGMVNFETIGGQIIECHLRFADQWPDLYGEGWVDHLIELYARQHWTLAEEERRAGYSVVLFGGHGLRYRHPDPKLVRGLLAGESISSIQITFHEDKPPALHAMPPGGFRLAIVNCWELNAGFEVRERLALDFWSAQPLGTRKRQRRARP